MTVDKGQTKSYKYEYEPPEGGWGYIVTLGVSLMFIVTVVPLCAFGMVFGEFLAGLGDETTGITLANGIFNTVLSFTGLAANQLLQKYSCRKVGLLGAGFFFIGSFGTIFVTNLMQLIVSFGVLQGIGFGLMMPAVFSSFNTYFDKKKNVMMSVAQAIIVAVTIGWPGLTKILLDNYGFRGTVAIFSAFSLHGFVACGVLQPVKWHMKKVKVSLIEMTPITEKPRKTSTNIINETIPEEKSIIVEGEPLLEENSPNGNMHKPRKSVVSIGSYALTASQANLKTIQDGKELSTWQKISLSLDLPLFKDPVYVNIAFGLSLSMTSDLAFLSVLPLLLNNAGMTPSELTLIMTIYFIADLACRILLSVFMVFVSVKNRYLFLGGTLLSAFFRTAFLFNNSFMYLACIAAALGFLRCLIQTPLPLVVAEAYSDRFTTAFSLYMVVCGVISLIFGVLLGVVRTATGSVEAVVHLLTVAFLLCGVPWSIEIGLKKCRGKAN